MLITKWEAILFIRYSGKFDDKGNLKKLTCKIVNPNKPDTAHSVGLGIIGAYKEQIWYWDLFTYGFVLMSEVVLIFFSMIFKLSATAFL